MTLSARFEAQHYGQTIDRRLDESVMQVERLCGVVDGVTEKRPRTNLAGGSLASQHCILQKTGSYSLPGMIPMDGQTSKNYDWHGVGHIPSNVSRGGFELDRTCRQRVVTNDIPIVVAHDKATRRAACVILQRPVLEPGRK